LIFFSTLVCSFVSGFGGAAAQPLAFHARVVASVEVPWVQNRLTTLFPELLRVEPVAVVSPLNRWLRLEFATGTAKPEAQLQQTGWFDALEPARTRKLDTPPDLPNDTAFASQQYYHQLIGTLGAWQRTVGKPEVVVGILDTGLDYHHPEFTGQLAVNLAEDLNGNGVPDSADYNGIDDDGNGYIDDVIGYDFVDQTVLVSAGDSRTPDSDPLDDNRHGTLVAGIVAARVNNTTGGAGIAPGLRLRIIRCFSGQGIGEDDDIARGVVYAVQSGCRVLNCSFGDIYPSQLLEDAFAYAVASGLAVVASAGNTTGRRPHYPSDFSGVISVSASDYSPAGGGAEFLWPLSSYGPAVALCAPGARIFAPTLTTTPDNGSDNLRVANYGAFNGTSCSAPMVSAACGLLWSLDSTLTAPALRQILTATADDIAAKGWDEFTGAGRLNVARAVNQLTGGTVRWLSPTMDAGVTGTVPLVVQVLHPQLASYTLAYRSNAPQAAFQPLTPSLTRQTSGDTLHTWATDDLEEGSYELAIRCVLTNGKTEESRIRVVIDRTPPNVAITFAGSAWVENQRQLLITTQADEPCRQTLYYRRLDSPGLYRPVVSDKRTRLGTFVWKPEFSGVYAYHIQAINAAGDTTRTADSTVAFQAERIGSNSFVLTEYTTVNGYFYPKPVDGRALAAPYSPTLALRPFTWYGLPDFTALDSIQTYTTLFPRAVLDIDLDGLPDLLTAVGDTVVVFRGRADGNWTDPLYIQQGQGQFGVTLYATAQNRYLVTKDTADAHTVWRWTGSGFEFFQRVENPNPNRAGAASAFARVADLDNDGQPELIIRNYEGILRILTCTDTGLTERYVLETGRFCEGDFLAVGRFGGSSRPTVVLCTHTNPQRNETLFEYEPPYWQLHAIQWTGAQFEVVHQDAFFNLNATAYSFVEAQNLDEDPDDEILFVHYPRGYILDSDTGGLHLRWYGYGILGQSTFVADFDANGRPEIALGGGDSAVYIQARAGWRYQPPLVLSGYARAATVAFLQAGTVPGAVAYRLFGAAFDEDTLPGNTLGFLTSVTDPTALTVPQLPTGARMAFVLVAVDAVGNPVSESNFLTLQLQDPAVPLQATCIPGLPEVVELTFNRPVSDLSSSHLTTLRLTNNARCERVISSGTHQLLTFWSAAVTPDDTLVVEAGFEDATGARLQTPVALPVACLRDTVRHLYFTDWKILDNKTALLSLNRPPDPATLTVSALEVLPQGGRLRTLLPGDEPNTLLVTLDEPLFGPTGRPVSLRMDALRGQAGEVPIRGQGDVAYFETPAIDLSDVYVYPNPVRVSATQREPVCTFAGLPVGVTIEIYSSEGLHVKTLKSTTDRSGGLTWNLLNVQNQRVRSGVYTFIAYQTPGGTLFKGQFAVVE
jgi:hypothetical protein